MNRLFLVAAAATSVITLYGATAAQASPPSAPSQPVVDSGRFDLGAPPLPLDPVPLHPVLLENGQFEITVEDTDLQAHDLEADDYGEHPLNDAWLGMPFKTGEGNVMGFVVDAPVDDDGEVTEVHVGTPELYEEDESAEEAKALLVFPADQVVLTDEAVILLPSKADLLAKLAR